MASMTLIAPMCRVRRVRPRGDPNAWQALDACFALLQQHVEYLAAVRYFDAALDDSALEPACASSHAASIGVHRLSEPGCRWTVRCGMIIVYMDGESMSHCIHRHFHNTPQYKRRCGTKATVQAPVARRADWHCGCPHRIRIDMWYVLVKSRRLLPLLYDARARLWIWLCNGSIQWLYMPELGKPALQVRERHPTER